MHIRNIRIKKVLPVCISSLAALQLLLASCGITALPVLAFLTCSVSSNDSFSAGSVSIDIIESGVFPDTVSPGTSVSSDNTVSIRNTGSVPCYVRLKLIISNDDLAEHITVQGLDPEVWDTSHCGSEAYDPTVHDRLYGYYYYTRPLEPGSVSAPVLTGLNIDSETDEDMLMNYKISLYAESIQQGSGSSWQEAWEEFS